MDHQAGPDLEGAEAAAATDGRQPSHVGVVGAGHDERIAHGQRRALVEEAIQELVGLDEHVPPDQQRHLSSPMPHAGAEAGLAVLGGTCGRSQLWRSAMSMQVEGSGWLS